MLTVISPAKRLNEKPHALADLQLTEIGRASCRERVSSPV